MLGERPLHPALKINRGLVGGEAFLNLLAFKNVVICDSYIYMIEPNILCNLLNRNTESANPLFSVQPIVLHWIG